MIGSGTVNQLLLAIILTKSIFCLFEMYIYQYTIYLRETRFPVLTHLAYSTTAVAAKAQLYKVN